MGLFDLFSGKKKPESPMDVFIQTMFFAENLTDAIDG